MGEVGWVLVGGSPKIAQVAKRKEDELEREGGWG